MVKINKVITRGGDHGETSLVGGTRVGKDSLRIEVCGNLDELNAFMGLARTLAGERALSGIAEQLALLQNQLFDLGAELATPHTSPPSPEMIIHEGEILQLEEWTENLLKDLPELKSFVLPGGSMLNSALHIARTICRRLERRVVQFKKTDPVRNEVAIYLNRLSDFLFALTRFERRESGQKEYLWKPAGRKE